MVIDRKINKKGGRQLKERRAEKKEKWITDHLEEWYVYSLLLLGNQTDAKKLVEETVHRVKNEILFTTSISSLKPLLKAYKKYNQENIKSFLVNDNTPLLNNLFQVKKEDRAIIVLKFIKKLSISEIKKRTKMSNRRIKEKIYQNIPIWTKNGKLAQLTELEEVVSNELTIFSEEFTFKHFTQKVVSNYKKEKKEAKKRTVIFSTAIILIFIIGGSINKETIQATRLGNAPDIYEIYKDSDVLLLQTELYDHGYTNVYIDNYNNEGNLDIYIDSTVEADRSEEINDIVSDYLAERNLDYQFDIHLATIESNDYVEEVEKELTEEELAEEKEYKMNSEIYELISNEATLYTQGVDENNNVNFTITDDITQEDEGILKNKIKEIMQNYGIIKGFTIEKIPVKHVDIQNAFLYRLSQVIQEAFYEREEYGYLHTYAYYENNKLTIAVQTSLIMFRNEENKEEQQRVRELKRALSYFLSHKEISEIIQNEPYEIKIYDTTGSEMDLNGEY